MPKKTKGKFKVIKFYRRAHEQHFPTQAAALAHLKAEGLSGKGTPFYAEVWQMEGENSENGVQIALLENGLTELVQA